MLKGRRPTHVIGRGPLEKFSGRHPDKTVVVRCEAQVLRVPLVPDARIAGGEATGDLACLVGGRVVRDDELEVPEGLPEQRAERLLQERRTVVPPPKTRGVRRGGGTRAPSLPNCPSGSVTDR